MDSKAVEISIPNPQNETKRKSSMDFAFYFFTFLIIICTMLILVSDHHHYLTSQPKILPQTVVVNYFVEKFDENLSQNDDEKISCYKFEDKSDEILENFYENFPKVDKFGVTEFSDVAIDGYLDFTSEVLNRVQSVTDKVAKIANLSAEDVAEFFWDGIDDENDEIEFPLSCFADNFYEIRDYTQEALALPKIEEVDRKIDENYEKVKYELSDDESGEKFDTREEKSDEKILNEFLKDEEEDKKLSGEKDLKW